MKQLPSRCAGLVVMVGSLVLAGCDPRVSVKVETGNTSVAPGGSTGTITVQDVTKPASLRLVCPPEIVAPTRLSLQFHGQLDGKSRFSGPGFRSESGANSKLVGRVKFSVKTTNYVLEYVPTGVRKGWARIDYTFE